MKNFIFVLLTMLSIGAHAVDGCKSVDPKAIAKLSDSMTVDQVDAVLGCKGEKTESRLANGEVWYGKSYNDFGEGMFTKEKKIKSHVVLAVFRDGKLMCASGMLTKKVGLTKYLGLPLQKCTNRVCKPA